MRHRTHLLPFLLEFNKLVGHVVPVLAIFQCLSLFAERIFLSEISLERFARGLIVVGLSREKRIASTAEALKDFRVHLLRRETDGFPFCLKRNHLLGLAFPVGSILERFKLRIDFLNFLAERRLLREVFLFAVFQFLEVLLMAFVDNG